jgi:hypothetical protein
LHEDLDYSQMYSFIFYHDDKFWTLLTIKDIQNQNQQHLLKMFNTCAFKKKHMWPFLWNILEPIINLKTFDEGLSNKKHVQILESLKGLVNKCFVYDKGL